MKKRGRPPITTGRFSALRRDEKSLYVAELTNGLVKIGFSDNPKTRLRALDYQCQRQFGCGLDKFHVFYGVGNRLIESQCIEALTCFGRQHVKRREFFHGVSFDAARFVIEQQIADDLNRKAA